MPASHLRSSVRGGGALRPAELAEAAILADLAVGLHLVGRLIPGAGVFTAASVTPFAVLAVRHRPRVTVVAAFLAGVLGFIVAGSGMAWSTTLLAFIGLVVGTAVRRRWSLARTVLTSVATVGVVAATVTVGLLAIFASLRELTLDQVRLSWRGISRVLAHAGATGVVTVGTEAVNWALAHWWLTIPASVLLTTGLAAAAVRLLAAPVVERLSRAAGPVHLTEPLAEDAPAVPVPVQLRGASYRYHGASHDALRDIDLDLPAAAFVAVVGPNGSGKSTLARLLTGTPPTSGSLQRPGSAGLGRLHGTALVAQRPESQVLGVRVRDDVLWGLPDAGRDVDAEGLLALVGLDGLGGRETSTLSGGQLQRLAIAAALAREPRLLVCDESTAMLDPDGRHEVVELLRRLRHERAITVVLVTHRLEEAAGADLVVRLEGGRVVGVGPPKEVLAARSPEPPTGTRPLAAAGLVALDGHRAAPAPLGPPLLRFSGAGFVYAAGTPWEHRALAHLDLLVEPGEGLVVMGDNGSGKSTLAWLAAGLLAPTEGSVLLEGRPTAEQVGRVGVAFQNSRLQLFRPTVALDVAFGLEAGRAGVDSALRLVGLDPARFAKRHIDRLSGGEQRRVALAGLLARRPRLLVLDEPLAGLDEPSRLSLTATLDRLRTQRGVATIVVTHDVDLAGTLGERVVHLEGGHLVADRPLVASAPSREAGRTAGGASR